MSIFAERYLGRTRFVEGLVESWKVKHDQTTVAKDIDELVAECVDLSDLCRHAWNSLWQLLRLDPNGQPVNDVENAIKEALAKTLEVFQSVHGLIVEAQGNGIPVALVENFAAAAREVREISAKVHCVYPQIDDALAEEAIAAFKRGECIPIEDLIREAQSGHLAAH